MIEETIAVIQKTMNCPYCGEEILAVADKCKHCGEMIPGEKAAQPSNEKNSAKVFLPLGLGIFIAVCIFLVYVK